MGSEEMGWRVWSLAVKGKGMKIGKVQERQAGRQTDRQTGGRTDNRQRSLPMLGWTNRLYVFEAVVIPRGKQIWHCTMLLSRPEKEGLGIDIVNVGESHPSNLRCRVQHVKKSF
jgi:hypothetical protein